MSGMREVAAGAGSGTSNCISYGLIIHSEIELPELEPLPASRAGEPASVQIRVQPVSATGIKDGKQLYPWLWTSPQELWLNVAGVARFLIRQGREILIDPEPGIDEDSVRVFLLGSAFGALLFQRGLLVLHGNAIRIGNRCMICVSDSGAGKSTLAAGFMQRGYQVLSDDVVPVDDRYQALTGFPRIKLWQETADRLGIDTRPLRRIRPETEKFNYPLPHPFAGESLPVRWIYVLGSHDRSETLLEPVRGMTRFELLHANTYRISYMQGMALQASHLKVCGALSRQVHLVRIIRPAQGFELDALMDHIMADIASNP